MATERRTYILIVRSYIHILQENIITFNPIMSNVRGNLILFILVTFAFPTNKFYPALCGRAWSLSCISLKQLFLFIGVNVHNFRDDTLYSYFVSNDMSNWIRDCFISGFFVCYAGFLLWIKVQDVLYTKMNVFNGKVEVLQGYICNVPLACHSSYEPSPYSAHWLDLPVITAHITVGKINRTAVFV
jgi:hypothetical protein